MMNPSEQRAVEKILQRFESAGRIRRERLFLIAATTLFWAGPLIGLIGAVLNVSSSLKHHGIDPVEFLTMSPGASHITIVLNYEPHEQAEFALEGALVALSLFAFGAGSILSALLWMIHRRERWISNLATKTTPQP